MERFELFYSSGGHVGPFHGREEADQEALDRLAGFSGPEHHIDIRPYSADAIGGFGRPVARAVRADIHDRESGYLEVLP